MASMLTSHLARRKHETTRYTSKNKNLSKPETEEEKILREEEENKKRLLKIKYDKLLEKDFDYFTSFVKPMIENQNNIGIIDIIKKQYSRKPIDFITHKNEHDLFYLNPKNLLYYLNFKLGEIYAPIFIRFKNINYKLCSSVQIPFMIQKNNKNINDCYSINNSNSSMLMYASSLSDSINKCKNNLEQILTLLSTVDNFKRKDLDLCQQEIIKYKVKNIKVLGSNFHFQNLYFKYNGIDKLYQEFNDFKEIKGKYYMDYQNNNVFTSPDYPYYIVTLAKKMISF